MRFSARCAQLLGVLLPACTVYDEALLAGAAQESGKLRASPAHGGERADAGQTGGAGSGPDMGSGREGQATRDGADASAPTVPLGDAGDAGGLMPAPVDAGAAAVADAAVDDSLTSRDAALAEPQDASAPRDADVAPADQSMDYDAAGDPHPYLGTWAFDKDLQGWKLGRSVPENLSDSSSITYSPTIGYPRPGATCVDVPFGAAGQSIQLRVVLPEPLPTGARVVAQINLQEQDGVIPVELRLYARSGTSGYAVGARQQLTLLNTWVQASLSFVSPFSTTGDQFVITDIRELGVELLTNEKGTASHVVVCLDTVVVD